MMPGIKNNARCGYHGILQRLLSQESFTVGGSKKRTKETHGGNNVFASFIVFATMVVGVLRERELQNSEKLQQGTNRQQNSTSVTTVETSQSGQMR